MSQDIAGKSVSARTPESRNPEQTGEYPVYDPNSMAGNPVAWTTFRGHSQPNGTPVEAAWGDFVERFREPLHVLDPATLEHKAQPGQEHLWEKPATLPGFSTATFDGHYRQLHLATIDKRTKLPKNSLSGVQSIGTIGLDFDDGTTFEEAATVCEESNLVAFIYTSMNHRPEAPRLHVQILADKDLTRDEYTTCWRHFNALFGGKADEATKDASRFWYDPAVVRGYEHEYEFEEFDGEMADTAKILASTPPEIAKPGSAKRTPPRSAEELKWAPLTPDHPEYAERVEVQREIFRNTPPYLRGEGAKSARYIFLFQECGPGLLLDEETTWANYVELYEPRLPAGEEWLPEYEYELRRKLYQAFLLKMNNGKGPNETWNEHVLRRDFFGKRPQPQRAPAPSPANDSSVPEPGEQTHVRVAGLLTLERGDHVELAKVLIRQSGESVFTEGSMYAYDPERGVWDCDGQHKALCARVHAMAGAQTIAGKKIRIDAKDVKGVMQIATQMCDDPNFFDGAPLGLACTNGFVYIETSGAVHVRTHDSKHRAKTSYGVAYEPGKNAPRWQNFLEELFRDDTDKGEKILLLQEFFGGALFGMSTKYDKCIIAPGNGSNGKSTLIEIITALFPPGRVQAFSPQSWESDNKRAKMLNVLLNVCPDMPTKTLMETEIIKKMIAGDPVDAELKYKDSFNFRPMAGNFFAAQKLPGTTDQTLGFWRRFMVLSFNRNFENDPTRDPDIAAKILLEDRAGVLCWLVEGASRLACKRGYTLPTSHHEALRGWRHNSDNVRLFLEECTLPPAPDQWAQSIVVHDYYKAWATDSLFKPVASNTFAERMKDIDRPVKKFKNANFYPVALRYPGNTRHDPPQE